MRKHLVLLALVGAMGFMLSCSGDEPFGPNEINVGENTLPILNGYYIEAEQNLNSSERTETTSEGHTHVFRQIIFWDDEAAFGESMNMYGVIVAFSKSDAEFKNGAFNIVDIQDQNLDLDGDSESFGYVVVFANPEEYGFSQFVSKSGKVKIGGEAPNYVIEFNLEGTMYTNDEPARTDAEETVAVKGQFKGEIPLQVAN